GCSEGADVGHQAARLLLTQLLAPARHFGFLAVEDARHQLGIAPPRVPGGLGEIGDLGQAVARRTPRAVSPVALHAVLPEHLAGGGCSGCRRGRLPGGRTLWSIGGLGLRVDRCRRRELLRSKAHEKEERAKSARVKRSMTGCHRFPPWARLLQAVEVHPWGWACKRWGDGHISVRVQRSSVVGTASTGDERLSRRPGRRAAATIGPSADATRLVMSTGDRDSVPRSPSRLPLNS